MGKSLILHIHKTVIISVWASSFYVLMINLLISLIRRFRTIHAALVSYLMICGSIPGFATSRILNYDGRIILALYMLRDNEIAIFVYITLKGEIFLKCFLAGNLWWLWLLLLELVLDVRQAALEVDVHACNSTSIVLSVLLRSHRRLSLPFGLVHCGSALHTVLRCRSVLTSILFGFHLPQLVCEFNLFWGIFDVTLALSTRLDRLVFQKLAELHASCTFSSLFGPTVRLTWQLLATVPKYPHELLLNQLIL